MWFLIVFSFVFYNIVRDFRDDFDDFVVIRYITFVFNIPILVKFQTQARVFSTGGVFENLRLFEILEVVRKRKRLVSVVVEPVPDTAYDESPDLIFVIRRLHKVRRCLVV